MTTRQWPDLLRGVAAAGMAVGIVIGCGFLWIGIPVLGFWLAGELTTTAQGYLFFVLPTIPVAMIGFGWLLYRLNAVYEGLVGIEAAPSRAAWLGSLSGEREQMRRARTRRTLIDVAMTVSAVTAMVLLVVWFFLFASAPLGPMQ